MATSAGGSCRWRAAALTCFALAASIVPSAALVLPSSDDSSSPEASAAAQMLINSNPSAFPVSADISRVPEYADIIDLAPMMSLVPDPSPPDFQRMDLEMAALVNSTSNNNNELSGRQSALRVMIVGDSMTHAQSGDYSWRYRIWQWFNSQGVPVQLVGPSTGIFPGGAQAETNPQPPQPPPLYPEEAVLLGPQGTGGYARSVEQGFLNNDRHFSMWGQALTVTQGRIEEAIRNNPTDLVLCALGFNDLGFFLQDADGLLRQVENFVNKSRAANPRLRFAIANVPHRTFVRQDLVENTARYNEQLPGLIARLSTTQSPVQLVEFAQNYACGTRSCPGAYDGLHPNAWGEFQIANAFSKSLVNGFGIGQQPLPIPPQGDARLIRDLPVPSNFRLFTSPQGASATWDPVFGAYGYEMDVSINGGPGLFSTGTVTRNRWDTTWALDGWEYRVRVRASTNDQFGGWTEYQTVTARPQLAPPPRNIRVQPLEFGFEVTWDPPIGPYTDNIVLYNIIWWNTTPERCLFLSGAAFRSSPARITGLTPGEVHLVAPLTWNANGMGLPTITNSVVPNVGRPGTPENLRAATRNAGSANIQWSPVLGAAGYEFSVRDPATSSPWESLSNGTIACSDQDYLVRGANNYEFSVSAYNGHLYSSRSTTIRPPEANGEQSIAQCPAPLVWCPQRFQGGGGGDVGGCSGCGSGGSPNPQDPNSDPENPDEPPTSTTPPGGDGPTPVPVPPPPGGDGGEEEECDNICELPPEPEIPGPEDTQRLEGQEILGPVNCDLPYRSVARREIENTFEYLSGVDVLVGPRACGRPACDNPDGSGVGAGVFVCNNNPYPISLPGQVVVDYVTPIIDTCQAFSSPMVGVETIGQRQDNRGFSVVVAACTRTGPPNISPADEAGIEYR